LIMGSHTPHLTITQQTFAVEIPVGVYQNKCVNSIYKKLKNNLVAEPVGPVKNGVLFFTSP